MSQLLKGLEARALDAVETVEVVPEEKATMDLRKFDIQQLAEMRGRAASKPNINRILVAELDREINRQLQAKSDLEDQQDEKGKKKQLRILALCNRERELMRQLNRGNQFSCPEPMGHAGPDLHLLHDLYSVQREIDELSREIS